MADLLEVDRRRGLFRMDGRGFCHGGLPDLVGRGELSNGVRPVFLSA